MKQAVPNSTRFRRPSRRVVSYALALLGPPLFSVITVHIAALYKFPLVLHFLWMIVVTILGGFGPGIAVTVASVLCRLFQGYVDPHPPVVFPPDLFRFVVMAITSLLIAVMGRRRRNSEAHLKVALDHLQERNHILVESLHGSKCASWILDLDSGKSARWYEGSYEVFGRPFAEIESMPSLKTLLHPEDQPRLVELAQQMRTSEKPVSFEYRAPWPNGELHWLEMRATRVPGKGCVWRGLTVDITERKLAEAALLRSEKLAAMGRIASTVAHEINNPLESVTNLLYLARNSPTFEVTQSYLDLAERELARLGNITRLTLGFVRCSKAVTVEISATVDDVLAIFRHRLDMKRVTVERRYDASAPARIAPHELRQIVTNLIANALDALPDTHATLGISILKEGPFVVLMVEDNGSGISAPDLQRIFEPFYTTKEEVGTGIGLWVTRELVEKHGGCISVESGDLGPNVTTRFRLELPTANV
jgi:PAS domain S-box-containing protein